MNGIGRVAHYAATAWLTLGALPVRAAIPDAGGVYFGCYGKLDGTFRLIDPAITTNCKKNEGLVQWVNAATVQALLGRIESLESGLATASNTIAALETNLNVEMARAKAAEEWLNALIIMGDEAAVGAARAYADGQTAIESSSRGEADRLLAANLAAEAAARTAADTSLANTTTSEAAHRETGDAVLQAQITSSSALTPYVSVTADTMNGIKGPNIVFNGANVWIQSGSGTTDDNTRNGGRLTGLGNLIVGYSASYSPDLPRTGSHNLVLGDAHSFSSYAGAVFGEMNALSGPNASVTGGRENVASGAFSSVSGGSLNTATQTYASVSGGQSNAASSFATSVCGGAGNTASGNFSSVNGGWGNGASGDFSTVGGGIFNTASGNFSSVSGGSRSVASGDAASVSGGLENTAAGYITSVSGGCRNQTLEHYSTVSGGIYNTASGDYSSVSGGSRNTASGIFSSVSGGAGLEQANSTGWVAGSSGATVGPTGFSSP